MAGLTADQIFERIANANGAEPLVVRQRIEQVIRNSIADPMSNCSMPADPGHGDKPAMNETIIALEQELYAALMPRLPGWEWDGAGYRNVRLSDKLHR